MREYNFDGLVGPTHNYGGLSPGNVASISHGGRVSNPRAAALQGLEKMRFVAALGVGQAVLPPQPRPDVDTLQALGFRGTDEEILARAAREDEQLLRICSSAAAMWTANAATVAPSCDTSDGRVHLVAANLQQLLHRAIEGPVTTAVLRAIFSDSSRFVVHDPLPGGGQLADEGAANHTRLAVAGRPAVHLFAWGRTALSTSPGPSKYPARQTHEASQAVARLLSVASPLFPRQHPDGIDRGAFHTDVLAVGNEQFLMLHELAFESWPTLEKALRERLGEGLAIAVAREAELPVAEAVKNYPFNSQVVTLPDRSMAIVAPANAAEEPRTKAFLERVLAEDNPVRAVHYLDVRESMDNGGGPACLRLRVPLTDEERRVIGPRVFLDEALAIALESWIRRHYRDRLTAADLSDSKLQREGLAALDELTGILGLGSVYPFQRG